MKEKVWKLRSKNTRHPGQEAGGNTFTTEAGFIAALHDAWRVFASDISATLPDGTVLDDAALRHRYPVR